MLKVHVLLSALILSLLSAAPIGHADEIPIDWTHYHNFAETTELLESFNKQYKDLTKLYSIGKSVQGKDLWCLEITNYATGAGETKPGMYIDGNTHAGEVSGAEASLYVINNLLTRYGQDPLVTQLLDTRVFYIVPKINPDGSDEYLRDPRQPPPSLKKFDDDGDGLEDEDGPDDLNNDGIITMMRIRDDKGSLKTSTKDPRLMVKRGINEKGEWRIIGPEGLDNDGDGDLNEDPPGYRITVTNRNYPAFWGPAWIQGGSRPGGNYPLFEPEAKAQVDFILAHPNIAGIQSFHTHSGVFLRPYCNRGDEHIPPEDMRNYMAVSALGTELTGYPVLSVYNDFTRDKSNPRRGVFVDWAYDHYGAFAYTTEIWKAPGETGRSVFDGTDEDAAMEWNDKELGGSGFVNWTKFDHPEFGEVEIGGWNRNTFSQNPPKKFMEAEWKKNWEFQLLHAQVLPYVTISETKTEDLGDKLIRLTATIENESFLPTYVTQKAIEHKLAKPVLVTLSLDKAELLSGKPKTEIGHIKGLAPAEASLFGRGGETRENFKSVEWLIRVKGNGASANVTVVAQKAGTASKQVVLEAK
jgi:murein tripeptide amidase MpaA